MIETGWNIASAMVNADLTDLDDCVTRLGPCARSLNAARSAVEMALLDLAARARGKSVVQLLGGEARTIEVPRIIPVKSPARMAELAGDYAGQGYHAQKLKATGDIDADVERVTAVRAAVGAAIALTVDANQGYDMAGALAFERCLRPLDVWSIEQPVPATDRETLAALRREARVRIEADEGLFTHADLDDVLAREAADSISLKLARSGGLLPSRSMALAATCKGVHARLGTAFGGPLVTLASATLAGLAEVSGPAECAEFTHFDDMEHEAPQINDGLLQPGEGAGFGQHRIVPWPSPWFD
ncbi:MAG: mandelate racemase/muconate lactonizing enzyme family protein [Geminicoccaceae bacterium]|nr:mandelate racemase/muconate lactonizing enzyme family protein [Geminicoccaceae bacterium]